MLTPTNNFQIIDNKIYSPLGEEFLIQGTNMFAWEGTSNADSYLNDWGFNTFRVPNYLLGSYNQPHPNTDGYATNHAIVNAFTSQGAVVIFDAHDKIGSYYQGAEFEILKQYWRDMAREFKDNPYVWFNLSNEPGNGSSTGLQWVSYHRELIDIIRAEGANNLIVVDGEAWGQDYLSQSITNYAHQIMAGNENILFSIHAYDQWNGKDIDAFFDTVLNQGIPIIVGEYGSNNAGINTLDATRRMMEAAQERDIGRILWTAKADDSNDVTLGQGGHAEHFDGTNTDILTELGKIVWGDLQRTPDKLNGTDGNDTLIGGNGNYLLQGGMGSDRLEAGIDNTFNSSFRLKVGTVNTSKVAMQEFESVNFETNFTQNPLVFTKVQTYNDTQFVRTRQRNTTSQGFQVALEEEEALIKSGHATENIGWLAIESGSSNYLKVAATGDTIQHQFQTINFNSAFERTPRIFSSIATYDGSDPSGLRFQNLNTNSVEVRIQEDQSKDTETSHTNENVNYFAFNGTTGTDFIRDVFGNIVGEMGSVDLSNESLNIKLLHDYINPVIFAQVSSYVGDQPVDVRIASIQSDNFTAFLEEPEYLDGVHWYEKVDYFVFEKGEWLISEFADFDVLIGGSGNDTLVGGTSADKFVFNSPDEGIDTIENFSISQGDKIFVNASNFGGGLIALNNSGSPLVPEQFYIGSAATQTSHRFIYDSTSGNLYFDSDGVGGTQQIHLAQLSPNLMLSNNDIYAI